MNADKNVTAELRAKVTLNVGVSGAPGSVTVATYGTCTTADGSAATCPFSIDTGDTVTLTAKPKSPAIFAGWSGCPDAQGNVGTLKVNASTNVSAAFDFND